MKLEEMDTHIGLIAELRVAVKQSSEALDDLKFSVKKYEDWLQEQIKENREKN